MNQEAPVYLRTCNLCGKEFWGNSRARAIEMLAQHKNKEH